MNLTAELSVVAHERKGDAGVVRLEGERQDGLPPPCFFFFNWRWMHVYVHTHVKHKRKYAPWSQEPTERVTMRPPLALTTSFSSTGFTNFCVAVWRFVDVFGFGVERLGW